MADYQYYNGFTLTNPITGKTNSLSDFGGEIYNLDNGKLTRNLLPEPNHITDKNDNCNGERYIKTTYGTRIIEVPVFFRGQNGGGDLTELNKWLGYNKQQIFAWEDDDENKCIDVIYNKGFDMDIYYGNDFNAVITLNFIAHDPLWYIKNERETIFTNIQINEIKSIKPRGNVDSFPLIKITPRASQSKIKFKWNDLLIELNNIDKPFYIDCEKEKCYEIVNNIKVQSLLKYKSDGFFTFPNLSIDIKNTFILLEGNISEVSILPRSKII